MTSRVIVLTIAVGTLLPAIASGDVIHLKNGNTLQGEVASEFYCLYVRRTTPWASD